MFNLIVKHDNWAECGDTISSPRLFEHTNARLVPRFAPDGHIDMDALAAFPTLLVKAFSWDRSGASRVVKMTRARAVGNDFILDYTPAPNVPAILNCDLEFIAAGLGIDFSDFSETHWSVKDTDLFRELLRLHLLQRRKPTVFEIADQKKIDPSLVLAMLPYQPGFVGSPLFQVGSLRSSFPAMR